MLELKNIRKVYPAGGEPVHALKGISLQFRDSDFVSVLGPSGCGKTTMLNLIGGLDSCTEGDLIINGRSTKDFRDRDWDAYRNHSIGFVFQSYHLIPHQTVLQNVELALSLSGVSKSERKKRAKAALEAVGLGDQLRKKPAEMSGGQMQRVAIARALVNDPEIILADEPTGALDTETGVQVMEILRQVAENRLVIMVTHNPELAERYSTRIIRMLDGKVIDDSAPPTPEETAQAAAAQRADTKRREKKPSLSARTAFGLSLKNLFTKKGRTALTSFAGSIGIIGIALIFAVSQGMTTYIDTLQEDTLASYPLTLEAQSMDMSSLMETFMDLAVSETAHENDAVYQKGMVYNMIDSLSKTDAAENDLKTFKAYLEDALADETRDDGLREAVSGVRYTYNMDLLVYTEDPDGTIILSDTQALMQELVSRYVGLDTSALSNLEQLGGSGSAGLMSLSPVGTLWQEMLAGQDGSLISPLLEKQYDVIYGRWPSAYNEVVLVVDENNEIHDMTLYALGLRAKDEIDALADAAFNKTEVNISEQSWSYEEICNMEFRVVFGADCYTADEATGTYTDLRETQAGLKYLYDNGTVLKVTGIIRPSEDAVSSMLNGTIAYTSALTEYVVENAKDSAAIRAQLADPETDIFTGLPFRESAGAMSDAEKAAEFTHFAEALDESEKADVYTRIMCIPSQEELDALVEQATAGQTRADIEATLTQALVQQMGMAEEDVADYIRAMSDDDLTELFTQLATEQVKTQYAAQVRGQLAAMSAAQLAAAFDAALPTYTEAQCAVYHDEILEFSDSDYETNLRKLSYVDLDDPASINLYASSFENKDVIEDAIAAYNERVDELDEISYTDYVGLMMSSVTTIINAITYVLVAFVAISLIVSSIMIGVITLISVQERTKEIGILRALGASKRNISYMFNAETVIIGFTAGALGVLITYLLCIPINLILHSLTGISNLNAILPLPVALILVAISVLLTLVAGIIPSRSAAKKDPVAALRTE